MVIDYKKIVLGIVCNQSLSRSERVLMSYMALKCNKNWTIKGLTQKEMMEEIGVSRITIWKNLERLKELGYLEIQKTGKGKGNVFGVNNYTIRL